MEAVALWIQVLTPLLGALWLYGSASASKRAQFKKWVSDAASTTKPHLVRLSLRIACAMGTALAAWICWESAVGVYTFKTSLEPITRHDVFRFLIDSFNALTYAFVTLTAAIVTIKLPRPQEENGKLIITLKPQESLCLSISKDADIEPLIEALRQGQARLHLTSMARGRAKIMIEAPKELQIVRNSTKAALTD